VGPEACNGCHDDKYKEWRSHPHSRMNAFATDANVRGDFSGKRVKVPGGEAIFAKENGKRTMTLVRGEKVVRSYAITRTVGSRFMQFYIGRQVEGPEPAGDPVYVDEVKLPYGYWFKLARWLPVSYFDPVGAETKPDGTPAFDPFDHPRNHRYASNCMLCHNTYPYVYRLALPDALHGIPADDGHVDIAGLKAQISQTLDLSGPKTIRDRLDPDRDLVTLGVSCESCHFGGREHAKEDGESPLLPVSPILAITHDGAKPSGTMKDVYSVNLVCAQCHRATITLYPNGCGTWNSREALDMLGGACKGAIKCTDCHDPHKPGGPEAAVDKPQRVAACTKCHEKYGAADAAARHSGHPTGAGVSCLDCHMPRTTQGLEEVVRTHRISSPTDAKMLAAGSWNSCNLCHLDKPIGWTLDQLAARWGKKIVPDDDGWQRAYGNDLSRPVGVAWLEGADPSMRLVASQAWSRSPLGKDALPRLVLSLDDAVAVNRVFAMFAVERVTGTPLSMEDYDVISPPAVREKSIARLLERLSASRSPSGR
jgi:hypothetical protein